MKKINRIKVKCADCQQDFWLKFGKLYGIFSDNANPQAFYRLYCQPPFPNYKENIYVHCRQCLVFFRHACWTDKGGRQSNGAIYIDKNGLCIECRNNEQHVDHPCLFSKKRVWGQGDYWKGLFRINLGEK